MKRMKYGIVIFLVIVPLLIFEILARAKLLDPLTFIPFTKMLDTMIAMLFDPVFFTENIVSTFSKVLIAFLCSMIIGIVLGIWMWRSKVLYYSLQPYIMLYYAVPIFAIYPVCVSIFGLGRLPIIVLAIFLALPSICTNTANGLLSTKQVLIKVGLSQNLTIRKMFVYIYLPSALPFIFTGLRLGLAYSMIGVIGTEFLMATSGLGYIITLSYASFDLSHMYGAVLLVIFLLLFVNTVLGYFESKLYRREIKGV